VENLSFYLILTLKISAHLQKLHEFYQQNLRKGLPKHDPSGRYGKFFMAGIQAYKHSGIAKVWVQDMSEECLFLVFAFPKISM
jgi:hypothetical protein